MLLRRGHDQQLRASDGACACPALRDAGLDDDRADEEAAAVRAAVRSMSGAGWIGVEYVGPWADGWAWLKRAQARDLDAIEHVADVGEQGGERVVAVVALVVEAAPFNRAGDCDPFGLEAVDIWL